MHVGVVASVAGDILTLQPFISTHADTQIPWRRTGGVTSHHREVIATDVSSDLEIESFLLQLSGAYFYGHTYGTFKSTIS